MTIAIVDNKGSQSDHWIEYCKKKNIEYKIVNPYDSDIVEQLSDCDAFMWHHYHFYHRDCLFAKQLLFSLEKGGKVVYPSTNSGLLFDDKVGEKYLLESIGVPTVPSYVFYTKREALDWIKTTSFPKVFKLRVGASSANVMLVKSEREARRMVRKAFGRGFPLFDSWNDLKERIHKYRLGKADLFNVVKGVVKLVYNPTDVTMFPHEKGYAFFQDFIPNNSFDTRVLVIGNYAFGFTRLCRKNDFRASGSGLINYAKNEVDERCVKMAFSVTEKLNSQSLAIDFLMDNNRNPLVVEISYGFVPNACDECEGYWDRDMHWHPFDGFDVCGSVVEVVLEELR